MKEVVDKISKRWIRVEVTEPVTITTKQHLRLTSSYTSYMIRIENNHWAFSLSHSEVRRRFSDFCWLRSKLQEHHPNKTVPPLPPKHWLHITNFDPQIIQNRCMGLEKFLQRVLRSFVFLSDAALHLFLQSTFTLAEIEEKLVEEIKPKANNVTRAPRPRPSSFMEKVDIVNTDAEFHASCSSGTGSIASDSESDGGEHVESSSGAGSLSDCDENEKESLNDDGLAHGFNVGTRKRDYHADVDKTTAALKEMVVRKI